MEDLKSILSFIALKLDMSLIQIKTKFFLFLFQAYEWWLNEMYLDNMVPLPVVSNPAWVFPRQVFETRNQMFNYLAQIIHGISLFKQDIEK